ncbi:MAG: UbiA family prenyltransferase [Candidatus Bathyarchaeota archaeon]|nr:UbiA family prenyltransferase [Candidatus Bathyarchaeota archaeon]
MFDDTIFRIKNLTLRKILALFLVCGRAEYFAADMLPFWMGVFLGISLLNPTNLHQYVVEEGYMVLYAMMAVVCAHYVAVWSNNLGDYDLDKAFKSPLSDSIDLIGRRKLWTYILILGVIGTFLIVCLSLLRNTLVYIILWAIGVGVALAYSCEPLRLKKYVIANEITRGTPLVVLLPFGYFLIIQNFSIPLTLYTLGLAVNLLGLFMIGEIWCCKDDKGYVNTAAVVCGYRFTLNLGILLIPLGIIVMMLGYSHVLSSSKYSIFYLVIHAIVSMIIMGILVKETLLKRNDYNAIEAKCGLFTKVGTTSIWVSATIGLLITALF